MQNVPTTHHLTLYRAASGALVFGAGTVQWTWGLDDVHDAPDPGAPTPDPRMQQAQVNLLADMGAQPTTLMAGLTQASASTDTARPTVSITTPHRARAPTVRGSPSRARPSDAGGGQVAGVEVSTDRGLTWHPAVGTSNWSYTYTQHGYGARGVWVRAIDDSANIGPKRTQFPEVSCPCSIFGGEVPPIPAYADPSGYELGLRFTPTRDGQVTGVRFYKGPGNGGTHVGRLWNVAGGPPLAEATFTSETATGWQEVSFASPVTVTQDQSYVVSYSAPQGNYPLDYDAFETRGVEAHPLSVSGGFAAGPGPSFFGAPGTFPSQEPSGRDQRTANYFVDVLFQASGPPDSAPTLDVTDRQPAPGATGVPITAAVSVGFSAPVEPGSSFSAATGRDTTHGKCRHLQRWTHLDLHADQPPAAPDRGDG